MSALQIAASVATVMKERHASFQLHTLFSHSLGPDAKDASVRSTFCLMLLPSCSAMWCSAI